MADNGISSPQKRRAKKRKNNIETKENDIEEKNARHDNDLSFWSEENDNLLIKFVEENITENSNRRRAKHIFTKHINWDVIANRFETDTDFKLFAKDVRGRWDELLKNVRKLRTVPEMLSDVKESVKLHLGSIPSKPLTAYQLFCNSMRKKTSIKYPDMKFAEIQTRFARKWRESSLEKRKKYETKAEKKKELYDEEMKKFQDMHPEAYQALNGEKTNVCLTEKTPFEMFYEKKYEAISEKYPDLEIELVQEKLKRKWERLNKHKKDKYVQAADSFNEEQRIHSKENEIKMTQTGKRRVKHPKKAPGAYQLYFQDKRKELLVENPKLNFGQIAHLCAKEWKVIDPIDHGKYLQKAKELKKIFFEEHGLSKAHLKPPPTAFQLFSKDKRRELLEKKPKMTFGKISSSCGQEWKKLDAARLKEYKAKADQLKAEARLQQQK